MAKGSQFERDICRELSLWWSGGKHDDLFWRTAGSGGRATVRRKKGKGTKGHAGDITNTSSHGRKLMKFATLELKRGYNKSTLQDLLDVSESNATPVYANWIKQAEASMEIAKSETWWIIVRRDRKEPLLICPIGVLRAFENWIEPIATFHKYGINVYRLAALFKTRSGKRLAKEIKDA